MRIKNLYYVSVGIKPGEQTLNQMVGYTMSVAPKALLIVAETPKQAKEFANLEYQNMPLNFKWRVRKIGTTTMKIGVMALDVVMKQDKVAIKIQDRSLI